MENPRSDQEQRPRIQTRAQPEIPGGGNAPDTALQSKFGSEDGNKRVRIGIPFTDYREKVLRSYLDYASQFGEPTLLLPGERRRVDLLMLTGGPDHLFEDEVFNRPSYTQGRPCPIQTRFLRRDLPYYMAKGTPVFGICLGFQVLAAYYGSILYAHVDGHRLTYKHHKVQLRDKAKDLLGLDKDLYSVTSKHHQAVYKLAHELIPVCYAVAGTEDNKKLGLIESFYHYELKVAGVQWHPEDIHNTPESVHYGIYGDLIGDPIANSLIRKILSA